MTIKENVPTRVRDMLANALLQLEHESAAPESVSPLQDIKRVKLDTDWFFTWMPYCFQQVSVDPRDHLYLPLNRAYNTLGNPSRLGTNPTRHLDRAVRFHKDPHELHDVWRAAYPDSLYLYGDDPKSRRSYFERLIRVSRYLMVGQSDPAKRVDERARMLGFAAAPY